MPLPLEQNYRNHHTTRLTRGRIGQVEYLLDAVTLHRRPMDGPLGVNTIACVTLQTDDALFCDNYRRNRQTGGIILVDPTRQATVAAVMLLCTETGPPDRSKKTLIAPGKSHKPGPISAMPRAFITGITGQDGSYLAELLLNKGYEVHGLVHRPDALQSSHIRHLVVDPSVAGKRLILHNGAFEDATHLRRLIGRARPNELYHLAGQSSPRLSLELPESTVDSIGMATLRLLEILRDLPEPTKFLYASSSEVFGSPAHSPQDEQTPVNPTTPYGAAKAFSQQMARIYRVAYGLPCCAAILYNHESPRRGGSFVTMKIARAVARIKRGLQSELLLGSLEGRRDWGWAPDYVRGLWSMLQQPTVDDFVLATGELHSVEELVDAAFRSVELNWRDHVRQDPSLLTSVEPIAACGNPGKARRLLGWQNTVPFREMIERLVDSEMRKLA